MEDAREARRKKLMSRGNDRLAFITGQSRSLPPLDLPLPPQPPAVAAASSSEENVTGSATAKTQANDQISSNDVGSDIIKEALPLSSPLPKFETSQIFQHETNNESSKNETSSYSNRASGSAPKTGFTVFMLKRFSSCITASENIRILCSFVVAFLVVLLHHVNALSVNFRPLLLVLLTDLTVVFGWILFNQVRNGDEETRNSGREGDGSTANIGKLVEAAILFQKAVGAVFMDCSVCAVIMICGMVV